jgi:hypothetical protein
MALVHLNLQVNTTATRLFTVQPAMKSVAVSIQNNHSASIYVGDSSITTSGATQGHIITAGSTYQLWLNAGDMVYAISAAQTSAGAISVLYSGV